MIKAVLPSMRRRRRGHIINITSMAGYVGIPGISYYSGSKFALEGITETLAQEVKNLGVKGHRYSTGLFSYRVGGSLHGPLGPLHLRLRHRLRPGRQAPQAAQVLLDIVQSVDPPTHLLLGRDAVKLVRERLAALDEQIKAWEPISCSTDYT